MKAAFNEPTGFTELVPPDCTVFISSFITAVPGSLVEPEENRQFKHQVKEEKKRRTETKPDRNNYSQQEKETHTLTGCLW